MADAKMGSRLTVVVACVKERLVVRPTCGLDGATMGLLGDALLEIDPNVVLDLSALELVDHAALPAITMAADHALALGGEMVLVDPPDWAMPRAAHLHVA